MDLISEAAGAIDWLRDRLGVVLPEAWLRPKRPAGDGPRARRPTGARTDVRPDAPAPTWADWEVSRGYGSSSHERARPAAQDLEKRER